MKKYFLTSLLSILLIINGLAQTATTTVAVVTGTSGQVANVPVTVAGINEANGQTPIIGLQVSVTYQTGVVSYLECVNLNTTLGAGGSWIVSAVNNGTVAVNWLANDISIPLSVTDGETLFEIRYLANNGGTSPLNLINVEYYDVSNNILTNVLNNGSITFGAPASASTWNGTGTWYTAGNWSNGIPGSSTQSTIASGVVTIDAATGYSNNVTINPGAGVTINSAKTLSINGTLTLASNSTATATGSLLNNGTLNVSGTTTVKRYLTAGIQHFISIPVTSASIQTLIDPSNTGYIFNFVESTGLWNNPWQPNYQLAVATGYSVNYNNAETISLTNPLNNDSQYAPTITRNGGGWNLVGNPYACPLDWTIASGWTKTNLDNATYIWNNNVYASFVNGIAANGGSKYIPQFQGFFVHASAASPAIAIKKAARTHNGNDTLFLKESVANVFRMSISNGTLGEETVIYLSSDATTGFDSECDAYKLFGFSEEAPHIYTRTDDVDYAINGQPQVESVNLPLLVKTSQAGDFTFNASGFDSFDGYYFFILEDKETGINYDLKQNSELTMNLPQGEINDRFTIRIFKSALGIGDSKLNHTRIYSENKSVYIENCPESQVTIYSMTGEPVASGEMAEASLNSLTVDVPTGIYIVKMIAQDGILTSKVFIK
jgi:fibronectin-binding autotransporter adhesin